MPNDIAPRPRPFQRQGIEWLVGRQHALLADTMGLGKSMQAIRAAHQIGAQRVLIVAPKATITGWQREIALWSGGERQAAVVQGGKIPTAGWVILPWSRVVARCDDFLAHQWDVLILDEAHYAKSGKGSQRAVAALGAWDRKGGGFVRCKGLVDAAERAWMLTGTPMPNRPIELHPLLQALQVQWARGKEKFGTRYCYRKNRWTYRGYDFQGAQNLDELNEKLTSTIMLRRTPEMVPGQLPEIVRDQVPLRATREMREAEEILSQEAREALTQWEGQAGIPGFEDLSAYRRQLGEAKAPAVADWVEQWLKVNERESIVVFGHHQKALDMIAERLGKKGIKTIVAHGGNAADSQYRQSLVDDFAEGKDGVRVFLGSTGACGTGMNGLHLRAHVCAFAEQEWTPGEFAQAEGRIRRLGGQHAEQAVAYYLVAGGGLEEHIVTTVTGKIEDQSVAIDGAEVDCLEAIPVPPSDIARAAEAALEEQDDGVQDPATLAWTWRRNRSSGAWLIAVQRPGPDGEEWRGAEVIVRRRSGEEQRRVLVRRVAGGADWSLWGHTAAEPTEQERALRWVEYLRRRAEGRGIPWGGDTPLDAAGRGRAAAARDAAVRLTDADGDHAVLRNDDGWSAADTTIGRYIVEVPLEMWTAELLKFATITLRKYSRTQIPDVWPIIAGDV